MAKPASITPHTKFNAEVYVLSKDEGGDTLHFSTDIGHNFILERLMLLDLLSYQGTEMVMPGDNIQMTVTLIQPIAMEEGLRFAIREGGRTVGAGVVSKIIE